MKIDLQAQSNKFQEIRGAICMIAVLCEESVNTQIGRQVEQTTVTMKS